MTLQQLRKGASSKQMSQVRPSKGVSILANWLRELSLYKKLLRRPIRRTSLIFHLPDETFVSILSNFPTYRPEDAYYFRVDMHDRYPLDSKHFNEVYGSRRRVLFAFTQVCRSMRQKFLSWLWEHLQYLYVRSHRWWFEPRHHWFAQEMFISQSRMLVAKPLLAAHVKTFSIYVSDAPDLANLLPLLPNLETLEVYAGDRSDPYFGVSFEAVNLPQVRVLIIDVWTHFLMKCCTNFKRVVIQRRQLHFTYRESISFVADSLVHLALCCPAPHHIREVVPLCPNLEEFGIIQADSTTLADCISAVQGFKKLRLLEVVSPHYPIYRCPQQLAWESRMNKHAITVLGGTSGHTKAFKTIFLGRSYRLMDSRDAGIQIITIP